MNKFISFALLILCSSFSASHQQWHTDLTQAMAEASEKSVPIILVFQGSDWCAPCIRLDREVWGTEAFKAYAEDHYVMLHADFPRKKQNALTEAQQQANNQLAERYNPNGIFPFVVVLDHSGKVLFETGYKGMTPKDYITHLNTHKS